MTIADYLIKQINAGNLRTDRPSTVKGMGEVWSFYPDKKYGPGYLVNKLTGSIMSVAEISDRVIEYNDWQIV
jgi:hypothetical protein